MVVSAKTNTIANDNDNGSHDITTNSLDFDKFLLSAGEFGRYQCYLFLSLFPFYVFGAFTYFGQIFLTEASPNHWCLIPELEHLTESERRALAIPLDENKRFGYDQCNAYVANWSLVLSTDQKPNASWPTAPCKNGWEFDKTEFPYSTITSEMGWVCDKSNYQASAQSFFFIGSIVGGLILGLISDRFGRLLAAICANMLVCVAGIASIYAQNFIQFSISRFFVGMGYDSCMMMIYLLSLEYVAPKYRTIFANVPFALYYTIGICSLPWIALACGHWKLLSLVISAPMALILLAPVVMLESPRWLLSKGRIDETVQKVLKVGRINKIHVSQEVVEQFKKTALQTTEERGTIIDVLKRPLVLKLFIFISLEYMCSAIIFDVSARTVGQLKFDFFVSFTIISLTEFPALLVVAFILDLIGRRWLSIISFFITAIFCFLVAFIVPEGLGSVICAVVARFAINMAYSCSMQWAAELLPTPIRGSGVAIIHICGFIATVISPFIAYLGVIKSWLPMGIVTCLSLFSSLMALLLPETAKIDLPQTFEDTENMIRSQEMWDIPCYRKKESN